MDADSLIARACLVAIPGFAVAGYVWRVDNPADPALSDPALSSSVNAAEEAATENGAAETSAATERTSSGVGTNDDHGIGSEAELERKLRGAPDERPPERSRAKPRLAAHLPVSHRPMSAVSHSGGARATAKPQGPCGGLEVRLITRSPDDPEWSVATVASKPGAPARQRRIGDTVGNWRVAEIDWDRVWFESGGARCAVTMHSSGVLAAQRIAKKGTIELELVGDGPANAPLLPEEDVAIWTVPESIAAAIQRVSSTEYVLSPDAVEELFRGGESLLSGLDIQPVKRDELVVGLRIDGVKPASLLGRLGVRDGDLLLAVNGEVPTTIADAVAAILQAREQERLVARLERDGESFDLEVRLRASV